MVAEWAICARYRDGLDAAVASGDFDGPCSRDLDDLDDVDEPNDLDALDDLNDELDDLNDLDDWDAFVPFDRIVGPMGDVCVDEDGDADADADADAVVDVDADVDAAVAARYSDMHLYRVVPVLMLL